MTYLLRHTQNVERWNQPFLSKIGHVDDVIALKNYSILPETFTGIRPDCKETVVQIRTTLSWCKTPEYNSTPQKWSKFNDVITQNCDVLAKFWNSDILYRNTLLRDMHILFMLPFLCCCVQSFCRPKGNTVQQTKFEQRFDIMLIETVQSFRSTKPSCILARPKYSHHWSRRQMLKVHWTDQRCDFLPRPLLCLCC